MILIHRFVKWLKGFFRVKPCRVCGYDGCQICRKYRKEERKVAAEILQSFVGSALQLCYNVLKYGKRPNQ